MSARLAASVVAMLLPMLGSSAACAAAPGGAQKLTVASADYIVSGEYTSVKIDRVEAVRVDNRRLVLKGAPADLVVDLPTAADPDRPTRHWALVTDAHVDGHRLVIFTEAESVKDVSIELPDSDVPIHFAVFAARDGGEILVFATGDRQSRQPSLYGHIAIKPK
jgi:hypothetical protein